MTTEANKSYVDLNNTLSMEELLGGATSKSNFAEGSIVQGKIVEKRQDGALLDIGYKAEGFIASTEFRNWEEVQVGDELDVYRSFFLLLHCNMCNR